MPVDVMRTIASVGSSMIGSGTLSTRTSRLPCQATAFMFGRSSKSGSAVCPTRTAERRTQPGSGTRRGPALGAREDLVDHGALGVRVVVGGVPLLARQLPLGVLIEAAVAGVVAQPVAEQQADPGRVAAVRQDVDVGVEVRRPVHPVPRLADADGVALRLERGAVRGLVIGVLDLHHHVDDPLGREPGDGGRAEVLDAARAGPERLAERVLGLLEAGGPAGVVVLDDDGALLRPPDEYAVIHAPSLFRANAARECGAQACATGGS